MSEAINHLAPEVDAMDRAPAEQARQALALCRRVAGMGHDLKTPLNAIVGYTELLLEDFEEAGDDAKVADLRKVLNSSNQLLGVIDALVGEAQAITPKAPR
jgi:signal transduction histidine kinase